MKAYQLKNSRWIVAEYDEKSGQYTAPMNERECKLTGCFAYCSGSLEGLGVHSYSSKAGATRWIKSMVEEC